tara:strand:+ start:431 stop:559 length:129 start_codon:yes stop_codon:yes gene_type:complete
MFNDRYKTPRVPFQKENLTDHSKNSNEMIKNTNAINPQKAID